MATLNPDGSEPSHGLLDDNVLPLQAGASQPLLGGSANAQTLDPVPMYPYGCESDGDPLFSLEPRMKG